MPVSEWRQSNQIMFARLSNKACASRHARDRPGRVIGSCVTGHLHLSHGVYKSKDRLAKFLLPFPRIGGERRILSDHSSPLPFIGTCIQFKLVEFFLSSFPHVQYIPM